jgi:hypothetical protein
MGHPLHCKNCGHQSHCGTPLVKKLETGNGEAIEVCKYCRCDKCIRPDWG